MKAILILLCLLANSSWGKGQSSLEKIWKSDKVAQLLGEVLFRQMQFQAARDKASGDSPIKEYRGEEWDDLERARLKIFEEKSLYGDCALVQMLAWCPDASLAEDINCNVTERGKKILGVLGYAKSHPPFVFDAKASECWTANIDRYIKNINRGERYGCTD